MVFQKRVGCASNGFHIPAMPRVPKSAKGKRSARKKVEDNQMSAFDLLASLAGKLLSEREGFWTPSNELLGNESPLKGGVFDQGSCDESTVAPPFVSHGHLNLCFKQQLKSMEPRTASCAPNDGLIGEYADKSLDSASPMESCVCKIDDGTVMSLHCKRKIEDRTDSNRKHSVIVSSESSVDLPPYGDCPRAQSCSFPSLKDGKALHGHDQENSSVCTHPCSVHSRALKPHCLEAHRRRKLKKSNYRKCDPASYNSGEVSNDDVEMKPVFRSQKLFYTRQRSQRSSFKRRKLFGHCSISPSCETSPDEVILDSLAKDGIKLEADNLLAALNGANNISCTRRGPNPLYDSEDRPVKLSIKSFKVPELFIEIPASATVGSLKRTVMEAVMAVLGNGLCVGILLQGKKVRDDSKTLRQAGISYEDKMDGLGFTLEPSPAATPPSILNLKEPAFVLTDPMPLNKFQASDVTLLPPPPPLLPANCIEFDHENSAHSSIDPPDNLDSDSKMLVPLAAANSAGALSLVPLGKSRRSEIAQQRRIRRPFSVFEVEALVQAVEKLGTGRWRDVKIRAFGDSKHRTYVDLKDKWKTLVHTARISPQQRRGEPVPQELLDRVLSAHAYWSHHQAKLPEPAEPHLLT